MPSALSLYNVNPFPSKFTFLPDNVIFPCTSSTFPAVIATVPFLSEFKFTFALLLPPTPASNFAVFPSNVKIVVDTFLVTSSVVSTTYLLAVNTILPYLLLSCGRSTNPTLVCAKVLLVLLSTTLLFTPLYNT